MYITNKNKELGVIVEDCVSACSVDKAGYTGIAILGTTFHESRIKDLMAFDEIAIALDKDASQKSLKIKKMLDPYVNCRVVLLPDDLKYFPPAMIQDIVA
jgi:DNA primase